jgi:putative spermidine/putrescine transport system permease protein
MNTVVSNRHRRWLYAFVAAVLLFLVVPVVIVLPMSFSGSRFLDFPPKTWSFRWYERFFAEAVWYGSMLVSLKLAVATTALATPLGVAAAYAIHASEGRLLRRLHTLLLMPLIVPHIIIAVGVFYVYVRIGWLGSFAGLLFAHTMLALPFVVVAAVAGLRGFDMTQEQVARSLGCTRLQAFLRVTLPQIKGSVFSGAIFAFVTSLDEVVVALFIASGTNTTVTKVMFSSLRDEIDPTIAAVSSLLIAGSFLVAAAGMLSTRIGSHDLHNGNRSGPAE